MNNKPPSNLAEKLLALMLAENEATYGATPDPDRARAIMVAAEKLVTDEAQRIAGQRGAHWLGHD